MLRKSAFDLVRPERAAGAMNLLVRYLALILQNLINRVRRRLGSHPRLGMSMGIRAQGLESRENCCQEFQGV